MGSKYAVTLTNVIEFLKDLEGSRFEVRDRIDQHNGSGKLVDEAPPNTVEKVRNLKFKSLPC